MADVDTATDNKPVEDPLAPVEKRIYVGGLPSSVTPDQLQDRFAKFGSISNVTIALNDDGQCRGFGHFTIDTTAKQWTSCLSVYNGSRWKGEKMRLEESKPDYIQRKRQDEEKAALKAEKKRKREVRWNKSDGFFARDMSLVTDNNVNTRAGKWKRGRYGRAIAVMRLQKEDGTRFVYDPLNYKNNLEKLYNINVRMKPSKDLPMFYQGDHDDDDEPDQDAVFNQRPSHIPEQFDDEDITLPTNTSIETSTASLNKDKGEERRLAAIERRSQEQQAKWDLMKQSEKDRQHISFEGDDDAQTTKDDDETKEPQQPKDGAKWMFDSDEDDDEGDLEIRINPVLEGEKGRERLELQSRFQGDNRFKMDTAFMDDDDEDDTDLGRQQSKQTGQINDDITKDLGAEKDQALDVLRSMFGDIKVMAQKTKPDTQWSSSARFDPDAEDSSNYLIQPKEPVEIPSTSDAEDDNTHLSSTEHDEDDDEDLPTAKRPESAMPEVSQDKHYSVNVNLKPLFGAEEEPFSLFGGNVSDNEDDTSATRFGNSSFEELSTNFIPKTTESQIGLGLMFFMHSDDPKLVKSEKLEAEWRTGRTIISEILKKREKSALRKQRKHTGRDLK
ncbi:hypothetical protein [Absidia glauca]|uniref:RRM domain-containing protein n=1 Tax=Absidia glauca TaxID=4829 RepID=A0A168MTG3_ABSGL|nr:hypothetical protein [Absidia glauca]